MDENPEPIGRRYCKKCGKVSNETYCRHGDPTSPTSGFWTVPLPAYHPFSILLRDPEDERG